MSLALYLPQHEGYLPKWLLLVSVVSTLNTLQAYTNPTYTGQLYAAGPVTPLSSRKFGTWTFLSSVIRFYAAYYISDPHVYDLAIWTYGIALAHFVSEWLVFGSARAKGRFVSPLVVASASFAWMITQRGWYVK
ncbi:ergosterol biosynthesis protein [Coccidioides posadasii str. Silveira]|uniref:Ergosterol biosynthesis protein Erg28 n=3 Tax=Coccidioides posadasii TaxID=199306 RepID=E9DEW9_COCPS|nr:Erg28 like family protein [Coccidioides posadasii C735 delta SOWgp]EER22908.1 Erg28 like family protein [Coccidioides posadasii C735 delta SOWgp]EFW15181.1 ergosterol biosynthesis protein Erg28 [Coccidioides posadasii str. Silveira]KMM68993.1 Erg28 protein [Coccidioides posadasii RMSCC 3488]QVM09825.1 ergosterol biosynthesis protein [Coccidioides posadasii str. Silveira]|eukprot:XP_003065053.1 Erg28 like family protein [Coccidioides posadasii C735 delta SOWgp]